MPSNKGSLIPTSPGLYNVSDDSNLNDIVTLN